MMKKRLLVFFAVLTLCCTIFCLSASAAGSPAAIVEDKAGVLSSANTAKIKSEAERVAAKTGFNIVVLTSDDIGTPKTDAHTVEYADDITAPYKLRHQV